MYELLLDGITGEVLGEVTAKTSYSGKGLLYSKSHFQVGDRQLVLVEKEGTYGYDLSEGGESVLPEGRSLEDSYWRRRYGDSLFWPFRREEDLPTSYLVLRPDGNDSILETGGRPFQTGTDDFLFYLIGSSADAGDSLWCMEVATGECWQVKKSHEITIYGMVTDGELMFTCVPWSEEHVCWRLTYDETGRPVALELVSEDIGAE